jgi:hypothetical protein
LAGAQRPEGAVRFTLLIRTPSSPLRMTTRHEQHNFYFASNQIFNDLRSWPAILSESGLTTGLESRSDKITRPNH